MLKRYLVILVLVLLTSLFTVAYSQLFPPGMEPNKEKAEEKLEMLKIWKLTEVIDLKSEQTTEFFSLYKQFEELRRTHLKERRELVEKLKGDIESGNITQSSIENYNASIIELKKKLIEDESNIINQMSNILTPVQMAKFVVFEETFQEEMLGMIKKMKEEKERFKNNMEGGPR